MTVLYFGIARERTGVTAEVVALDDERTVDEIWGVLLGLHPRLADIRSTCRISVDQVYAADHTVVTPQSEIALIPPFAGG